MGESGSIALLEAYRAEVARLLILIEGYKDLLCSADVPHTEISEKRDITIRRKDLKAEVIAALEAEIGDKDWPDLPKLSVLSNVTEDIDRNISGILLARAEIDVIPPTVAGEVVHGSEGPIG